MRKISSSLTFYHKRLFPIFWFGFLGFIVLLGVAHGWRKGFSLAPILVPAGMMIFGYLIMKRLIFGLADEVYLNNDIVVVRNGGDEDCFPVTNILNVNASQMANPERITLLLRTPCKFGDTISFLSPTRWWPFSESPIAAELIRSAHGLE